MGLVWAEEKDLWWGKQHEQRHGERKGKMHMARLEASVTPLEARTSPCLDNFYSEGSGLPTWALTYLLYPQLGSGLNLLCCWGRCRAFGRPPGLCSACSSHSKVWQKWPSNPGGQKVPASQVPGNPGLHEARVLPGKRGPASRMPGLHLKPQADAQSPILSVSACSREGWEARRYVAA